jgi:5-methylcytosine-specific restriction protein A
MPLAPRSICPKCRKGTGCDCREEGRKERQRWLDERRGSSTERGYDWTWRQFALRYLTENPLCVDCSPKVTPATEVHHVKKLRDNPEFKYDEAWLMALCSDCHKARTAKGE